MIGRNLPGIEPPNSEADGVYLSILADSRNWSVYAYDVLTRLEDPRIIAHLFGVAANIILKHDFANDSDLIGELDKHIKILLEQKAAVDANGTLKRLRGNKVNHLHDLTSPFAYLAQRAHEVIAKEGATT